MPQLLSHVWLSTTPWTAAHQASLSITNSWSLPKLMSIESVTPCNHLILWCPLLLPPSIFPSIRVFSNESVLRIRWPKYWSFSFNISPSNEYSGLISFRMDFLDLLAVQGALKSLDYRFQSMKVLTEPGSLIQYRKHRMVLQPFLKAFMSVGSCTAQEWTTNYIEISKLYHHSS